MDNRRYDYSPIIRRPKIEWPESRPHRALGRAEYRIFSLRHADPRLGQQSHARRAGLHAARLWLARRRLIASWRCSTRYGIRASVLFNAEVCEQHPPIIEEGNKRKWEWLGHGMTNSISMLDYPPEEERAIIHNVKEIITKATGKAPKGWLGTGTWARLTTRPDHLAAEGFEYVCDWGNDEQPTPMRVKSGRMVVVPYELGVNDIRVFHSGKPHAGAILPDGLRSLRHALQR